MALTHHEAKVLAALTFSPRSASLTVNELRILTELPESSVRRALLRLSRHGLAVDTRGVPARWGSTERGGTAIRRPFYRQYGAVR